METFSIRADFIELFKLLKASGLCETGGLAKQMVAEGLVRVNGQVETRKACKIRAGQKVCFEGQEVLVQGPAADAED